MAREIGKCRKCKGDLRARSWRSAICEACGDIVDFGVSSGDAPPYDSGTPDVGGSDSSDGGGGGSE